MSKEEIRNPNQSLKILKGNRALTVEQYINEEKSEKLQDLILQLNKVLHESILKLEKIDDLGKQKPTNDK